MYLLTKSVNTPTPTYRGKSLLKSFHLHFMCTKGELGGSFCTETGRSASRALKGSWGVLSAQKLVIQPGLTQIEADWRLV